MEIILTAIITATLVAAVFTVQPVWSWFKRVDAMLNNWDANKPIPVEWAREYVATHPPAQQGGVYIPVPPPEPEETVTDELERLMLERDSLETSGASSIDSLDRLRDINEAILDIREGRRTMEVEDAD